MHHPFKVGEVYRNRSGTYEVARIDESQGTMIIRYPDTGEEFESNIGIQARILQNLNWDSEMARQEKRTAEARYQPGYGDDFTGLISGDFKGNIEGTTWRGRRKLAGRVARLLSAAPDPAYTFLSWAVYRWPVAFLSHREHYLMAAYEMGARKAKFTIELDEHNVYYGFYVERCDEPMDHTWDWPRLWQALKTRPALGDAIATVETDHHARLLGRAIHGAQPFHFANPPAKGVRYLWDEESPSRHAVAERLGRLEQVPEGEWIDLYLIATMPKEEALQAGVQIAHTIAVTMEAMLPIYTAATQGEPQG
jgi:hypothetical protein